MKIRVARTLIQVALSPFIFTACNDSTAPGPGLAWSIVPSGTVNELDAVWGTSASNVWAVGYETILHYDGATWSVASGSGGTLFGIWLVSIWGSSASDIWAVGFEAGGTPVIFHYDGAHWSRVPSPSTDLQYTSVSGSSASDVWAAGPRGFMSHYDGLSWSNVPSGAEQVLTAVWASSSSDAWAIGIDGIFHYDVTSWAPVTGTSGEFLALFGTSQSDVWAVGQGSRGPSHYDGTSWSDVPKESAFPDYALGGWASSRTAAWAVGVDTVSAGFVSRIAYYNGTTWSDVAMRKSSAILVGAWGSSATDVWVVGEGGTILHGTPAR